MSQQNVDALSVDQLWSAVCLAHRECQDCNGSGYRGSPDDVSRLSENPWCFTCHLEGPKPGRVWALPGMQERCPGGGNADTGCFPCDGGRMSRMTEQGMRPFTGVHESCHGTGWVLAEIHAETLQNALQELFASEMGDTLQISFSYYNHADPFVECKIEKGRSWLADARGDTALRAMVAAAVKAVQAGQEAIREA